MALAEMAIGPNSIGRNGSWPKWHWPKWLLAKLGIGPSGVGRNGIGRNGFERSGNSPFMMDHSSYTIILQIHTFNLPKILEKPPFILPLSTFKSSRKICDLLGMYHSKQGCALCMYIRPGA